MPNEKESSPDGPSLEELLKRPWNSPGINFLPGRYYLCYGLMRIGRGFMLPHEGDVIMCLWRFDNEPDLWRIQFRTRWYAGENTDPWDNNDRKMWMSGTAEGTEEDAFKKANEILHTLGEATAEAQKSKFYAPDWIMVKGDDSVAYDQIMNSDKEWMHKRTGKVPQ